VVLPASGWTIAGPGNRQGKFVGWRALSLPYIEQANLQARYDFAVHWWENPNLVAGAVQLKVFQCPTVAQRREIFSAPAKPPRPAMQFPVALAPSDYEAIMGLNPVLMSPPGDPALSRSAMFRNSTIPVTAILDGTSNTILVVECVSRPLIFRGRSAMPQGQNDQCQGWVDSESSFSLDGSNADGTLQGQGPLLTPRAINATNENEPYSFHSGGANFVFADGHVRFIRETVKFEIFAALCTRSAGEPVTAGAL
jgi:prepilin-type processing-associated H-X9-DG protein